MMPNNQLLLESPESSSPIITRAVAAGLQGVFIDNYQLKSWQKPLLYWLGAFPQQIGRMVISRFQTFTALAPTSVTELSVEKLASERVNDYADIRTRFPVITIGAALGGASAHISLALRGPFLPQAFVLTLKGGSPDGDARAYLRLSIDLALKLAERNPSILTIQHFDPVHDGWLTKRLNHLRLKLLDLPDSYKAFLHDRLEPGGAICYLDCGAKWLRYRLGERSVFQVGGWGDISPQEYMKGSDRLERYCRAEGLRFSQWHLSEYPLEEGAESEWGCESSLGNALERFCIQENYRFFRIGLPSPHDYSRLAFRAVEHILQKEAREPAGVLVEVFSQFDATAVVRSGLLPVWLVFNTLDNRDLLRELCPFFPAGKPVFFSPLSTFSPTPDLVPWADWEEILFGLDWRNIGTRPSHYPSDVRVIADWSEPLRRWVIEHENPFRTRLHPEELQVLSRL